MINKLALFITHNIFLNENQLKELFDNNYIKTIGISVPVWVNSKSGKTTEPAHEYYCSYEIINDSLQEEDIIIEKYGYRIFLPKSTKKTKKWPSNEELANLSKDQRAYYERKIQKWWKENPETSNIETLKKIKYFRSQIKKMDQKFEKINCIADVQHIIEIKTMDFLINTLC